MSGRYKIHFDSIAHNPPQEISEEEKVRRKDRDELYKTRKKIWDDTAKVVDGIPGKCVIVSRAEKLSIFVDKKLVDVWQSDKESILYYYNDIEFLSGTAGYILVCSDGKKLRQITLMS